MKKLFLVLVATSVLFFSCKKEEIDVKICTSCDFTQSSYNIVKDESTECNVILEPEGTIDFNNVEFSIINEKIAQIEFSEDTVCKVTGKKEGATILTAICGECEGKCIVNVIKKDEERKIKDEKNKSWYMYSITYEIEDGIYETTCFIKELCFDYELKDGYLKVVRDNGIIINVPFDSVFDFEIEKLER